jgi:hypothetical protein
MMMAHSHLIERGQSSPPAGHRHYSGVFLLCFAAFLGSLLHHDADLYPMTGSGFLFWMR